MGKASFAQVSFLGGEWSPQMQGRFDRDDYRQGMNVCFNVIPIEEGAVPRRSGTRLGGPTRNGVYAVLREYNVNEAQPLLLELTAGHLRVWVAGGALLLTGTAKVITVISSANNAVFTSVAHGLTTGDQVIFTPRPLRRPTPASPQVLGQSAACCHGSRRQHLSSRGRCA